MVRTPTYNELMRHKTPVFIAEDNTFFYVCLPTKAYYDQTMWRANKRTKEVTYMDFLHFIVEYEDKTTYIVPPAWATDSERKAKGS